MSKNVFRIVAWLIALVGLGLLLASPSLGEAAGQAILIRHVGGMDTDLYRALLEASITSYHIAGALLLGVGLFRGLEA